jgi:phosphonate transport system substrate-binding protein
MRPLLPLFVGAVAVLLLSSCNRPAQANAGPMGWPRPFRYNVALGAEDPSARAKRVDKMRAYLEEKLGIPVEITETTLYGGTIEAMRAQKIDAAGMGPFAYLIASEKAGAEAIVTRGSAKDGNPGEYAGTLSVPADSPLKSVDDLIKHASELTVSFVDPASASGYLVQRAYLDGLGIDPEKAFKKVVFSNNHLASALTLMAHKADVAAISEATTRSLIQKGRMKEGDIRVLWKSPPIPNSPVAVRKDLPADFKQKLQDVFVEMPPEVYQAMVTTVVPPGTAFVRINDATFDELRKMARGVKTVQLLEH